MSGVTNLHPPWNDSSSSSWYTHRTVNVTGNNTAVDYIVDIGLNATITPKFANSRIKIDVTTYVGADQANSSGYIQSYMIYSG